MYRGIELKSKYLIEELHDRGFAVVKRVNVSEKITHCPLCNKDCKDNLYFENVGVCEECDTL